MPVLKNARHEAFAQALAKGKTADEAYEQAGFKADRGNASRLQQKDSILQRVNELLTRADTVEQKATEKAIEKLAITKERVLAELAKIAFADIRKAVRWGRNPGDAASENADPNGLGVYPISLIPSEEMDGGVRFPRAETAQDSPFYGEAFPFDRTPKAAPIVPPPVTKPKDKTTVIPDKPDPSSKRISDFAREIRSIQERSKAIEAESKVIGLGTFAKEKMLATIELENKARRDAIGLTPERIAQINAETTAYAKQMAELERLQDSQKRLDEVRDAGKSSFKGLVTDIMEGESAVKSLGNAFKSFSDKLLDLALDDMFDSIFGKSGTKLGGDTGGGGIGSFFSSIFGGFKASGGPVESGKAYIVGEKGPEIMMPRTSGTIIPNHALKAANGNGGGGGTSVSFAPVTTIDARGADAGAEARMKAALDERDRQWRAQLPAMIKDAQRRSALR